MEIQGKDVREAWVRRGPQSTTYGATEWTQRQQGLERSNKEDVVRQAMDYLNTGYVWVTADPDFIKTVKKATCPLRWFQLQIVRHSLAPLSEKV